MTGTRLAPMNREEFQKVMSVSHETAMTLERYLGLLVQWNRAIALVSRSSLSDPWRRHILDCAQLIRHIDSVADRPILDLGSGAGLPGLVLAILGCRDVRLIEANTRKAAFLNETARRLGLAVTVHAVRSDAVTPSFPAAVVTARALAPVDRLLSLAAPFLTSGSRCLFLKGQDVVSELTQAEKRWTMVARRLPSLSDPKGTVLEITAPTLRKASQP